MELIQEEALQEMMSWNNLYEGDIIITDKNAFDNKRDVNLGVIGEMVHPWVIIKKVEDNTRDMSEGGDRLLICPLTSQLNRYSENDRNVVFVRDFKKNGLQKPSVIKVYQSTTISPYVVRTVKGYISDDLLYELQKRVKELGIKY